MSIASRRADRKVRAIAAVLLVSVACAGANPGRTDLAPGRATSHFGKLFSTTPERFDKLIRTSGGLPTVVNVWASWCIPCRAEMPRLTKAAQRYKGRVRFLGLNSQDDDASARRFIAQFEIPFPSATDPRGKVSRHLKVLGLPTTFFFAPDGKLVFLRNGEIDAKDLDDKLEELVATSGRARSP